MRGVDIYQGMHGFGSARNSMILEWFPWMFYVAFDPFNGRDLSRICGRRRSVAQNQSGANYLYLAPKNK